MVQLRREPKEIADTIPVAIGERLDMELIENRSLYHKGS